MRRFQLSPFHHNPRLNPEIKDIEVDGNDKIKKVKIDGKWKKVTSCEKTMLGLEIII